jgi:hypothetical protein
MSVLILIVIIVAFVIGSYISRSTEIGRNTRGWQTNSSSFDKLPYKVKKTLMTSAERVLFETLKTVLGPRYDIYPQMKLDKIFDVEYQRFYKYYLGYLRKINQKSVDYLVVNRQTQSPLFAIELDDFSHDSDKRRERDNFVGDLFKKAGLPLVRFNPGSYRIDEIKKIFEQYLN